MLVLPHNSRHWLKVETPRNTCPKKEGPNLKKYSQIWFKPTKNSKRTNKQAAIKNIATHFISAFHSLHFCPVMIMIHLVIRADAKYAQIHSGITYSGTQTQDLHNLIRLNIISTPPDLGLKLGLGYEALRGPMTRHLIPTSCQYSSIQNPLTMETRGTW